MAVRTNALESQAGSVYFTIDSTAEEVRGVFKGCRNSSSAPYDHLTATRVKKGERFEAGMRVSDLPAQFPAIVKHHRAFSTGNSPSVRVMAIPAFGTVVVCFSLPSYSNRSFTRETVSRFGTSLNPVREPHISSNSCTSNGRGTATTIWTEADSARRRKGEHSRMWSCLLRCRLPSSFGSATSPFGTHADSPTQSAYTPAA